MLGKLIKNEFVQRGRNVCLLWFLALGMSVFNLIVSTVLKDNISNVGVVFKSLVIATTVAVLIGSFAMIVGTSFIDYNTRLFKDQGYLTHTLPVKTEQILFARIIGDLVIAIITVILYPTFVCIAIGNFGFWKEVLDIARVFLSYAELNDMIIFIFTLVTVMFGFLMTMWHYYASYALGHTFSSGKRGWSIMIYISLYIGSQLLISIFIKPINELYNILARWVNYDELKTLLISMGGVIFFTALATVICFLLTNYACKKRLNLE